MNGETEAQRLYHARDIIAGLKRHITPGKKELLQRFFKTGPGEYAQGDIFLGVMVPGTRKVAREFKNLPLAQIKKLLESPYHEARLTALLILVSQFKKNQKEIYDFYLKNTKAINNWDLVDLTAHKIVGEYLIDKDWSALKKLAHSKNLWERRIAVISTFAFIGRGSYSQALTIGTMLLNDKHDLIHKAVGWTLREVGKRVGKKHLVEFLNKHASTMPRTMLRYAIEHLSDNERKHYLAQKTKITHNALT